MILADRIRCYAIENYMEPARRKGRSVVAIRSGDLHREMRLSNRMPAVCGALDAKGFCDSGNLELLK